MANDELTVQSNLKALSKQQDTSVVLQGSARSSSKVEQADEANSLNPNKLNADVANQTEERAEAVKQKVAELNQYVQNLERKLQFSVDDNSGDTVVKVIDKETDELIRQIPSEELLEVKHAIDEYRGILFETKA
jgi:flagellar protein FlaG